MGARLAVVGSIALLLVACAGPGATAPTAAPSAGATTSPARHFTPTELAVDAAGELYASDCHHGYVFKISTSGAMTAVAGTGLSTTPGLSGDGGPAIRADLACPYGLALDRNGALVIADHANNRVRRIGTDGVITTIVGSGPIGAGAGGFGGDGGAAKQAQLNAPVSILFDGHGSLYIGDRDNGAIRKVDPRGIITTIAGIGRRGFSGDGRPATRAQLDQPEGMALDAAGNLFFADSANNRIRRIDTHGIITTVAGTGVAGYSGDGGPATEAEMQPDDLVFDPAGNLYVAEFVDHVVRVVGTNGIIRTIAGTGRAGCSGYGGAATKAQLTSPLSPVLDSIGNLYVTDQGCNVVLRIDRNGIMRIFAGPA
jgi:sugar lactone lactonase YvrE